MNLAEFSDTFTTLLNSYSKTTPFGDPTHPLDIVLDEYEKSVFLTLAQEAIVIELYNGNKQGDAFETKENMRRYLDSLVNTKELSPIETDKIKVCPKSLFFKLPNDLAFITLEQIYYEDKKCNKEIRLNVLPIRQDEYNKIKENPFRGSTSFKALRLDAGDNIVEIIAKINDYKYIVRYLKKPSPIILENLPDGLNIEGISTATKCTLNPLLHRTIVERAVLLALNTKAQNNNNNK